MKLILILIGLALSLPILALGAAWLSFDAAALATLAHQASTVLPGYALTSLALAASVGISVALLGGATAVAVTLFDFPGRRHLEWALLLPLAMPAYVLAYAYTDAMQTSGFVQVWLRHAVGSNTPLLPDIRGFGGAVLLFTVCLYPYVFLLVRTALAERGAALMEAARMLNARLHRRILFVALPLARPALAAGVALALMETLADYGVGAYFGLGTFTTGIYRAWLSFNDRLAAAQLATVLLVIVAVLVWIERSAQARLRFSTGRTGRQSAESQPVHLTGLRAGGATLLCALPVLLGFLIPLALLLRLVVSEALYGEFGLPWARFLGWSWVTLKLAGIAAVCAALFALGLSFALRQSPAGAAASPGSTLLRLSARTVSLGYAVPGAVIAVGLLLPSGWLQSVWPDSGAGTLVTSTTFGLLYAYMVRFSAVAMQSVEAGYARIPSHFDDTARTLGARARRRFTAIHLPLLTRSALAAGLLVFVDVMKELPATLVLRPFNSDTLAVVAFQLARDERLAEAALPSLAIAAVGLAPVLLLARAMRQQHVTR